MTDHNPTEAIKTIRDALEVFMVHHSAGPYEGSIGKENKYSAAQRAFDNGGKALEALNTLEAALPTNGFRTPEDMSNWLKEGSGVADEAAPTPPPQGMRSAEEWVTDWRQRANKSSPLYETKFKEFITAIQDDAIKSAVPQWQAIETAPRDGTEVLLWWPHWSDKPCVGYWGRARHQYKEQWQSEVSLSDDDCHERPTHWMPLPAAPKAGT